jgi:hypothetical protein
MFQAKAQSPEELIASLPPDRAEPITKVREVILANLPPGYVESMLGETIARTPVGQYIAGYEKTRSEMAGSGKRAGSAG